MIMNRYERFGIIDDVEVFRNKINSFFLKYVLTT